MCFLPIAILLYWVSNNIWTYGQQHLVFRKIDHEDELKKQAVIETTGAEVHRKAWCAAGEG